MGVESDSHILYSTSTEEVLAKVFVFCVEAM